MIVDWTLRLGWILVAWLFALGGVVGSFLNVVVYRLPRGKSVVHPGSACPACGHPIRWYDNLPIVSWLVLGGRCRDCRIKISARYPLVELATAALFAGLFLLDSRPRILAIAEAGSSAIGETGQDVLVRYIAHTWLLSTLLCGTLIEFDGARVPRRIFLLSIAVGVAASGVFPASRQDASVAPIAVFSASPSGHAIAEVIAGICAGCLVGYLFDLLRIERLGASCEPNRAARANSAAWPLICVGTFLGWFAAVAIGGVAAIEVVIARQFPEKTAIRLRFGWSAAVFTGALVWVLSP